MIGRLQRQHSATYGLAGDHDIRDFLITNRVLAQGIGQCALPAGSGETLFVAEDDGELGMSLYLDEGLVTRVSARDLPDNLRRSALPEFCQILEGVSHFNCMAFKASHDREVSLLELELQGEVDKFVVCMQIAARHDDHDSVRHLHQWLFDNARFHAELGPCALERYRVASDYAARFCRHLRPGLLDDTPATIEELRHFFRLPVADKMSLIHSRCWQ
ncbi:MAG: hypothetical protein AAF270_08915 [Pseudomonadota bacterium]